MVFFFFNLVSIYVFHCYYTTTATTTTTSIIILSISVLILRLFFSSCRRKQQQMLDEEKHQRLFVEHYSRRLQSENMDEKVQQHLINMVWKEVFYLTTHSTHFIYGYMASDIW